MRFSLVTIAGCAALFLLHWFVPPPVALAGNGDFGKIIGPFSLGSPPQYEFEYAPVQLDFAPEYRQTPPFRSIEKPIAALTVWPARKLGFRTFDLRAHAMVHGALALVALWLWIRAAGPKWYCQLPVFCIFGNTTFVALLNSFYMDAAAATGILFTAAWVSGSRAAAVPAVLLLVGSKPQHAICAVPLAAWLLWRGDRSKKMLAGIAAMLALMVAMLRWGAPNDYHAIGIYSVIFHEALRDNPDPQATLAAFGLQPEDARYAGTHTYSANSGMQNDEFRARFLPRASYWKLARYYAGHPALALRLIVKALNEAGRQAPPQGNFPPGTPGAKPNEESHRFSFWTDWKRSWFEDNGLGYAAYALAVFATAIASCAWRARPLLPAAVLLASLGILEAGVSALTDVLDNARHFTIFNWILDVTLLCAVFAWRAQPVKADALEAESQSSAGFHHAEPEGVVAGDARL